MSLIPKRHIDSAYERELQTLRERLLLMAGRVEAMIRDSALALERGDTHLAESTIGQDSHVNTDEVEIDELCLKILARRQPLASDLRTITLTLKMVTDLERISDLAVNICERTIILGDNGKFIPHADIKTMATSVQAMVRNAIDAFVERDIDRANLVISDDDKVDDAFHRVCLSATELMRTDESNVEQGIHIISIAKHLERMGDHATNIAEQIVFLVRGKDIRHQGKLVD